LPLEEIAQLFDGPQKVNEVVNATHNDVVTENVETYDEKKVFEMEEEQIETKVPTLSA